MEDGSARLNLGHPLSFEEGRRAVRSVAVETVRFIAIRESEILMILGDGTKLEIRVANQFEKDQIMQALAESEAEP